MLILNNNVSVDKKLIISLFCIYKFQYVERDSLIISNSIFQLIDNIKYKY